MASGRTDNVLQTLTCKAENALSGKRGYIVELTGADYQIDIADAATDIPFGVLLEDDVSAGASCEVAVAGVVSVIAGAAVSVGAKVGTDASGRAVTKTTAGDEVLGVALSAASAAGEFINVLIAKHEIGA